MDRNAREKEMLYEWGMKNTGSYHFQKMDRTKDSYYIKRKGSGESYIREYTIETLPQIMKELDAMWGADEVMDQIKKVIGVASLKNKPDKIAAKKENMTGGKNEAKSKLPEFIYNF